MATPPVIKEHGKPMAVDHTSIEGAAPPSWRRRIYFVLLAGCLGLLYYQPIVSMEDTWSLSDSYYSHGYLIPFISGYLLWRNRSRHKRFPAEPAPGWGYLSLAAALLLILVGDLFSFHIFTQLSLLPMLTAVTLLLFGTKHFRISWFPLWFLFFMIPIPPSLTSSISVNLKFFATDGAVQLTHLFYLPIVQDGSYLFFKDDQLLVGDVCGGLRSLIALLALGTLMSYISKSKLWVRIALLVLAGPIAIFTNILRIFALCIIAYNYGSSAATGFVHDISGIMIFVVALALFFGFDVILSKISERGGKKDTAT